MLNKLLSLKKGALGNITPSTGQPWLEVHTLYPVAIRTGKDEISNWGRGGVRERGKGGKRGEEGEEGGRGSMISTSHVNRFPCIAIMLQFTHWNCKSLFLLLSLEFTRILLQTYLEEKEEYLLVVQRPIVFASGSVVWGALDDWSSHCI